MLFAPFLALRSAARFVCRWRVIRRGSATLCATRWPAGPLSDNYALRFATGGIKAVRRSAGAFAAPGC